jgi:2,3-bisphosphoglycerate-dependent phosphoglycerate mutase
MPTLILTRHGQSQWNLANRFTGWVDVSLTEQGIAEAERGGLLIAEGGFEIDRAYASVLTRAIHTCELNLRLAGQAFVPVVKDWRLNRAPLRGPRPASTEAETAARRGEAQVLDGGARTTFRRRWRPAAAMTSRPTAGIAVPPCPQPKA